MSVRWFLGVVLSLACAGTLHAEPPTTSNWWCGLGKWTWTQNCPSTGCCPDEYMRKPFPSICPVCYCGGPDDYCRKPLPCVPALPYCGGPDDYCCKPMPCLLCPPLTPWLQCGPADGSCSPCGKCR